MKTSADKFGDKSHPGFSPTGHLARGTGSSGSFYFNITTGEVDGPLYPDDDPPVEVDVEEYKRYYPNAPIVAGQSYDILDLGYFAKSGVYENPEYDWREEAQAMRNADAGLPYVHQNTDSYADVYIQINAGGEADWKFVVSLDKESGNIYESDPQFSSAHDIGFDVSETDPPNDILEKFYALRPKAIELLAGIAAKEKLPFNYEAGQAQTLTSSQQVNAALAGNLTQDQSMELSRLAKANTEPARESEVELEA